MKRINPAIILSVLICSGSVFAQQGQGMHHMQAMMKHANPMPNLMRVVKRHADMLSLTEEQSKALAEWRHASHHSMHASVNEVHRLENALFDASMSGKSKEEIMGLATKVLDLRKEIISRKTDCRDNMKSILTEEQFSEVVKLYGDS